MPLTHLERNYQYRARLRAKAFDSLGGEKCSVSGCKKKDLEFAHKKPTGLNGHGRGMIRRLLDVIKHSDCYLVLCRAHHRQYDQSGGVMPERKDFDT